MDFTIITPNLNYGHFLRECLESVASQEGVTLEHLVIDGGSTDESGAVASEFPHATWSSEKDRGMSSAINKGFDRAKGNWVMWLNADDRLKPGVLKQVLDFVSERPEPDLVYGDFDFIGKDGESIRRVRLLSWSKFVHVHYCCFIPSTSCFLRKRSVIDDGYRLREDFHYVMDGEFYARLAGEGRRFDYLKESLAEFRIHEGNASMKHLGGGDMESIVEAEKQHVESRSIRRAHGITLCSDPYLNGLVDGVLWIVARGWKVVLKFVA